MYHKRIEWDGYLRGKASFLWLRWSFSFLIHILNKKFGVVEGSPEEISVTQFYIKNPCVLGGHGTAF